MAAMGLALVLVNSPLASVYEQIHHTPMSIQIGALLIDKPLILWINDGLMVFFFVLVGLEIKREVFEGEFSSISRIALPGIAALGGMVVPAFIYLVFTSYNPESRSGWAIPTATDIVLALAILSLLGQQIPNTLKLFLTALAIFDDLGAIIIIALFYTDQLSTLSLALAANGIIALILLNRFKVSRTAPYVVVGIFLWVAVLKSGVHATLAGVIIAWSIPIKLSDGTSPLRRIERELHPWVVLGVVPLFAFFNAGIDLTGVTLETFLAPMTLGIALGLFFGKQIGIFGAVWLSVKLGITALPTGVRWIQLYGVSILAGIGFTMSLFIASFAFSEPGIILDSNFSVVLGSAISAIVGMTVLYLTRTTYPHTAGKSSPQPP